jgi:two-component system NarL family response regulator
MNWYYPFYMLTTFIAAIILLLLWLYAWRRRTSVPQARTFCWMLFVFWGWMVFWLLELLAQDVALKAVLNKIRYSFVLFVAYSINVFVLHFSGWRRWLQPQRLLLIAFVPIIGVLLIWTNPLHWLVWQTYEVVQQGAFLIPIRVYGPWFSLQAIYNHMLTFISLLIILHAFLTHPNPYRLQYGFIFAGTLALVLTDMLWIFRLVRGPGLYPFSLVFIGLVFAWSLFRHQFLDLVPIAHHTIVQTMNDGIIVLDNRERIVAINPAAQRFAGISETEAIGKTAATILPSHFSQQLQASLAKVRAEPHAKAQSTQGEGQEMASPHRGLQNIVIHQEFEWQQHQEKRVYDAQISPLQDQRGKRTGHIIVLRDITSRKQMEHALRASEERFRMLAEHAHHVIFRLTLVPTRHFDYLSPSFTELTGYTREEAYADADLHFKVIHPASRATLLMLSERQHDVFTSIPLRYIRKDGDEIWVEHDQWTIFDAEGTAIAIEGVIRDITQRKVAEQQVFEQQKALTMLREREHLARELHDSLGQTLGFLHIQAQEVQNLLTAGETPQAVQLVEQIVQASQGGFTDIREYILGVQTHPSAQVMQDTGPEQHPFFAALETYLREFSALSGIATDLQRPAEMQQMMFPQSVETHLLRIIQEALSNVRKHAQATRAQVRFALAEQLPASSMDTSLAGDQQASQIVVTIQDDGKGFVPPDLSQPQQDVGQTPAGYGLESMRSRAEECGGTLTIESAPATGTCLRIALPQQREQALLDQPIQVLLADDNPLFLQGIAGLLYRRGFQVVGTASNGIEAVQQALLLQPDIILMDIEMPAGGGLEATRKLSQRIPNCHIVMLTVSESEEHLFEAIKSGASGYLLKNIDADHLCTLLYGLTQGEVPLSPGIAEKILHEFARTSKEPLLTDSDSPQESPIQQAGLDTLRDYEVELLTLVARGYAYREIGEHMSFSERSVKRYMSTILSKLHLQNRADAITYARQQGLVP